MSSKGVDSLPEVHRNTGTTRNSFKGFCFAKECGYIVTQIGSTGKIVTRLEYQAYSKLALKTVVGIVREAAISVSRSEHYPANNTPVSTLIRCAVHHRLGIVPVGEPSIGAYYSQSMTRSHDRDTSPLFSHCRIITAS